MEEGEREGMEGEEKRGKEWKYGRQRIREELPW